MPRKKNKPVAEYIAAEAQVSTGGIPEHQPAPAETAPAAHDDALAASGAFFHATYRDEPDVSFNVAEFGLPASNGAAHTETSDAPEPAKPEPKRRPNARYAQINSVGIAVEVEMDARKPWLSPQTLILFRDDAKPTAEEKAKLSDAGFSFQSEARGWGMPKTAVSVVLAKRLVSELAKGRGDEGVGLYV